MTTTYSVKKCQLVTLPALATPVSRRTIFWQLRNRMKRLTKRRWVYLRNFMTSMLLPRGRSAEENRTALSGKSLRPGDIVRIRSKAEIQSTLSHWNDLKGCAMMEEMWNYCGTRQRVLKRVDRFLDERDYLIKQASGIVILEGVICNGTVDFGPCDRSCYFFWREEWLEEAGEDHR